MKEEGKLVIGPNTETVKMMGYSILVRLIDIPMQQKSGIILRKESVIDPLKMFNGFTPYMVEVIAVSKKAEEEGLSRGDICVPSKSFIMWMDPERSKMEGNPYTTEIHDGEIFIRATVGDIEAVLPYMRKYILKGKTIIDKI